MLEALTIFSGNANRELATAICKYVETPLGRAEVTRFADGEVYVEINENVRGVNCFVVQATSAPANDNLMELLVMIDALKRASAGSIVAVIPYFGYARQDRKSKPRTPLSARLVADLITAAGVDRVLSIDLHAGQIQGFFNIPVDHLFAAPVLIDYLAKKDLEDPVLVSPDAGGVERARAIAKRLNAGLAIIDRRRDGPNVAVFMHLIGDVEGKDVVIIDDMIDTAGTLIQAVDALRREGARRILAAAVPRRPRPRRAPWPRHQAHQRVGDRGGRHHQLRSARSRQAPREDPGSLGGPAGGRSDPAHPRRGFRVRALRLAETDRKEAAVMEMRALTIEKRVGTGKGAAKRLRRTGRVPAVLYGGKSPENVTVNPKDIFRLIHGHEGGTQLLQVSFPESSDKRMAI